MQNTIVGRPLPGLHQRLNLRGNVGVCGDHALGLAGSTRSVKHHRSAGRHNLRQPTGRRRQGLGGGQQRQMAMANEAGHPIA